MTVIGGGKGMQLFNYIETNGAQFKIAADETFRISVLIGQFVSRETVVIRSVVPVYFV